jgi:tetratricopeptide (TPR) repeat protein
VDELLADPFTTETDRLNLQVRRAYALADAERLPEAMKQFDDLIAQIEAPELKARLFYMKAEMLSSQDKPEEAILAYEGLTQFAEAGSELWIHGQQQRGQLLMQHGRAKEALDTFTQALEQPELELPTKIGLMASKAAAELAIGNRDVAVATARAAKELAAAAEVGVVTDFELSEAKERIEAVLKEEGGGK